MTEEQNTDHPTQESLLALWNLCKRRVWEFGIERESDVHMLIGEGYTFTYWVQDICDIVGYGPDEVNH